MGQARGRDLRQPVSRITAGPRALPVWQPLTAGEITSAVQAARTPQARLCVALAAIHTARPGQIRTLQISDIDTGNRRIAIAGRTRPLDDLTRRLLTEWLDYRRARWPHTANLHLLLSSKSALGPGPVSATWIRELRGQPATLDRLRIDRQLEEALTCDADPLHLAAVFGIDASTAIRYAVNGRQLLADVHAPRLSAAACRGGWRASDNHGGRGPAPYRVWQPPGTLTGHADKALFEEGCQHVCGYRIDQRAINQHVDGR